MLDSEIEEEEKFIKFQWPYLLQKNQSESELKNLKIHFLKYGFIEFSNRTFIGIRKEDEVSFKEIANFKMKSLYLIRSKSEAKRIFEITNKNNSKTVVDLPVKSLVNFSLFRESVESLGNYIFKGNATNLNVLKQKYFDENKEADEISTLGWNKEGFYSFSNGVFDTKFRGCDNYGIVEVNSNYKKEKLPSKYFFIPSGSEMHKEENSKYDGDKLFIYLENKSIDYIILPICWTKSISC